MTRDVLIMALRFAGLADLPVVVEARGGPRSVWVALLDRDTRQEVGWIRWRSGSTWETCVRGTSVMHGRLAVAAHHLVREAMVATEAGIGAYRSVGRSGRAPTGTGG